MEGAINKAGARGVASHRCTAVAIALARYYLDHGAYPTTLQSLVPTYLTAIPLDPFDGVPLRCKPASDAATIYSIGIDRNDDGGDVNQSGDGHPKDIGFRLAKPATYNRSAVDTAASSISSTVTSRPSLSDR